MDTCGRDATIKYGETVSGWRVILPLTEDRRARGTIRLRRGRLRDKQPFSSRLAEARSSSFRGLPQPFLSQPVRHRLSDTFAAAWREGISMYLEMFMDNGRGEFSGSNESSLVAHVSNVGTSETRCQGSQLSRNLFLVEVSF